MVKICKKHPSLIIAHPHFCQQYYNCSMEEDEDLTYRFHVKRLYLTECDYPFLFSTDTLKCENFTEVKCGQRYEIKYKCKFNFMNSKLLFEILLFYIVHFQMINTCTYWQYSGRHVRYIEKCLHKKLNCSSHSAFIRWLTSSTQMHMYTTRWTETMHIKCLI